MERKGYMDYKKKYKEEEENWNRTKEKNEKRSSKLYHRDQIQAEEKKYLPYADITNQDYKTRNYDQYEKYSRKSKNYEIYQKPEEPKGK